MSQTNEAKILLVDWVVGAATCHIAYGMKSPLGVRGRGAIVKIPGVRVDATPFRASEAED